MIFSTFTIVLSLVALFLFSIRKFSNQMQRIAGERFKHIVRTLTQTPLRGMFVGTLVTALIQSSTATTVMTVGLVDAGVITFYSTLGVIFGANIGSTVTTQLVALDLMHIAPYIVIIGFLLDVLNTRYKKYGKIIFYFGLVFFSLGMIADVVAPLQDNPAVIELLSKIDSLGLAILVGIVVTVLFQSSGIVSGLVLILVAKGFMTFDQAIGIIFGANIGTTSTALIASFGMDIGAKRAAWAHFFFNVFGVLLFIPFIQPFSAAVASIGGDVGQQVANAHVIFNILSAVIFLIFIKPFAELVELFVRKEVHK